MNFLRHLKPRNSKINLTNLFSRGFASDTHKSTTVDAKEVEIFSRVHDWWDPYGSMRPLHAYNYARVNYMKRIVENHSPKPIANTALPFKGFDILDVGCGGGILCEVTQ
jgi:2-polyprenyl-3-methyl-5-hydroxy-6-metoxy-1,4-benzoquinol methylase